MKLIRERQTLHVLGFMLHDVEKWDAGIYLSFLYLHKNKDPIFNKRSLIILFLWFYRKINKTKIIVFCFFHCVKHYGWAYLNLKWNLKIWNFYEFYPPCVFCLTNLNSWNTSVFMFLTLLWRFQLGKPCASYYDQGMIIVCEHVHEIKNGIKYFTYLLGSHAIWVPLVVYCFSFFVLALLHLLLACVRASVCV